MAATPDDTTDPFAELATASYRFDETAFPSFAVYRGVCDATATTLRRVGEL